MDKDERWLPWVLVLVMVIASLVIYGRGNHTEHRLRTEIQVLHECINAPSYTRGMIESQCVADYYEMAGTCTEDMPCWNCNTMGNRVCGKP